MAVGLRCFAVTTLAGDLYRSTARVRRVNLLGPIVDQRLEFAGMELRAQLDTHKAISRGLIFREGDMAGVNIANPLLFDSNTLEGVGSHE